MKSAYFPEMDTPTPDPEQTPSVPPTPQPSAPPPTVPQAFTPQTPEPPSPAPQPPAAPAPAPVSGGITEQQWIVFLHLSAFGGMILPSLGHILGPLIIWLVKKPESPTIDAVGRNVLNFQISWTIWMFVAVILAVVASCLVVPIVLPFAVAIAWVVFVIIGAMKASKGETYAFPLTIKML
jgi:uncharacterized Tic20 family protein